MFTYSNIDYEKHIQSFVAEIHENETPDKKCFTVCYVLSVYLSIYNISHVIKSGNVKTSTNEIGHYIVTLKHNEVDIDPTAQQIEKNNPPVLIQKGLYNDANFTPIEFGKAYEDWEYRLVNDGLKKPLPTEVLQNVAPEISEIEDQRIDIIPYLRILIKAYYAFKRVVSELESQGQQVNQEFVNCFFEKTNNIFIQNKSKKEKLGDRSVIDKYDMLLKSLGQ